MDHDSKGETKVDQTIQWARESLQRRRIELQEKEKALVTSKNNHDKATSSSADASTTSTGVQAILERGRALLAEAEAHSEILGKYVLSEKILKSEDELPHDVEVHQSAESSQMADMAPTLNSNNFMARFLQETNHTVDNRFEQNISSDLTANSSTIIARDLPVEIPDWDNECGKNNQPVDNEELQELLREGEARARLDELIATVRRQGDDLPKHKELHETPPKRIYSASFDPSSLKAAKRAALRKIKLDEEVAAAEEKSRQLTSFKALPLPGGAEVKNDLFASTQSFQGKQIGSVEKLVRRDTKCDLVNDTSSSVSGTCGAFDGISIVTSRTSPDNSFSFTGYENEEDREQAKQLRAEKKMKKRQLLDGVNNIISTENDPNTFYSECGGDIVEDPSKLRQDIARLEAKLKQKKTKRVATLNDIVDIDLNALFDRLVSTETGDDVKNIIGRLKDQVCGSVNDFQYQIMISDVKERNLSTPRRKSLYRRHEEWAKEREQKLFDARLQLEAHAMVGITGRPELSHAKRSWSKAKEYHDESLKRFAEEEEKKHKEKEAKDKVADEIKRREMEELQKLADCKLKTMKSEANKEEHMKRLEKLSQPRQVRQERFANVDSDTEMAVAEQQQPHLTPKSKIFLPSTPKRKAQTLDDKRSTKSKEKSAPKNSNSISNQKPDEFCGKPSFSEMTDKDFAKMVKRISKNAMAKVKESQQDGVQIIGNPESLAH